MTAVIGLYYLVTFLGAGALLAVQPIIRLDPVILEVVQFGPTLGVLAVLLVWRGRWRPRLVTGLARRPDWRAFGATIGAAALIFGLVIAVYAALHRDIHYTGPSQFTEPFLLIVVAQFVGACGEEFGWRAFLQPYLRTRFGVVTTGVLVGLLWGGWHVQYFALGPVFAGSFLVLAVSLSVIMVVLVEAARGQQLAIAGTFHLLINIGLLLLMPEEDGDSTAMLVTAGACAATASAVVALAAIRGARR